MKVSPDSWHARVYRSWYKNKYNASIPPDRSNLCPYMRAVLIWAPFRALFCSWITVFTIGKQRVTLNALFIPLFMYAIPQPLGYVNYYLKMVMWAMTYAMTIAVLSVVIGIHVIAPLARKIEQRCLRNKVEMTDQEWLESRLRRVEEHRKKKEKWHKRFEFWYLIQAYLRAGHDRVCPEVEIERE